MFLLFQGLPFCCFSFCNGHLSFTRCFRPSAIEAVPLHASDSVYNSPPAYSVIPFNQGTTTQDDPTYDVVFDNSVNAARARAGAAAAPAPADEGIYLTAPSEEDGYLRARSAPEDESYYSVCK